MPLNFNFTNVHNHEEVTTDPADPDTWHPVASLLVWLSMVCGYNEITLKNVDKVIARLMAYQAVVGPLLTLYDITPADIRRFVGMRTNATPMTDAQWHKRLAQAAMDEGARLQRRLENAQTPSALDSIAAAALADKQAA